MAFLLQRPEKRTLQCVAMADVKLLPDGNSSSALSDSGSAEVTVVVVEVREHFVK